jgi:LPXTG-motif cell wall-anchored protein
LEAYQKAIDAKNAADENVERAKEALDKATDYAGREFRYKVTEPSNNPNNTPDDSQPSNPLATSVTKVAPTKAATIDSNELITPAETLIGEGLTLSGASGDAAGSDDGTGDTSKLYLSGSVPKTGDNSANPAPFAATGILAAVAAFITKKDKKAE